MKYRKSPIDFLRRGATTEHNDILPNRQIAKSVVCCGEDGYDDFFEFELEEIKKNKTE